MKKITTILLSSIALLACKKETKTETKIDPVTGDTITVEVPKETTEVQVPEKESIAIAEENGVYTQKFILEKGQTYPLTTYQRGVQTMTGPDGKSVSGTTQSTDEMSFTVDDVNEDTYNISINLLGKNNSQSANGKTVTVDTKSAAPNDPQLKMMWNMNKALVGNKLQMVMKKSGEIVSIKGFEPIYTKMNSAAAQQIKDEKEKQAFINSFKESFNENTIKEQFSKNLLVFPKEGAKLGGQWTETEDATPDGSVKLKTIYTLKSIENDVVTLSVSGGIPKKSDKKTQEGITHTLSSELTQNGTITLNQKTGWINNQNVTVKTTQTESLSDGKQTQTMKTTSSTTVIVNPKK